MDEIVRPPAPLYSATRVPFVSIYFICDFWQDLVIVYPILAVANLRRGGYTIPALIMVPPDCSNALFQLNLS